jgi:metal-responsive CopG/Arc/MetJ family transcriptional regulator
MSKERITITIDRELLTWLDTKVAEKVFANRSHGLEFLIMQKKMQEHKVHSRGIT